MANQLGIPKLIFIIPDSRVLLHSCITQLAFYMETCILD